MSGTIEIRVPDIGDFKDIPVIEVLVSAGDKVAAEQSLVTLESDKATMEVPSPSDGVIREMKLQLNDTVSEGDVVAVLELASQEPASAADESSEADGSEAPAIDDVQSGSESQLEAQEEAPAQSLPAQPTDHPAEPRAQAVDSGVSAIDPSTVPYASPAVRRFSRELGADLSRVKGSGDKGRILREDVAAFIKSIMSAQASPAPATAAPGFDFPPLQQIDFSRYGDIEEQPLSRIQKLSGGHLHRNWVGIPHVTQNDEADITDMEAFRKSNSEEALALGFKLTPLVFLIKASVAALKKYPQFNASLTPDGEKLVLKNYFNIGIAVDTPDGLVVPVIRHCERKGIMELASELAEISQRAREKKLTPQDIQGGCFSISSLGGIGGTSFTPIINAPEVAILGVSRSRMQPWWDGQGFQPRLMLPLSLSYDHRVIDGAAGARFIRYLASRLEDLRRLTL